MGIAKFNNQDLAHRLPCYVEGTKLVQAATASSAIFCRRDIANDQFVRIAFPDIDDIAPATSRGEIPVHRYITVFDNGPFPDNHWFIFLLAVYDDVPRFLLVTKCSITMPTRILTVVSSLLD